ncbi:DUF1330 domain-containing protein [Bacillus sp. RAR_GA_16]|uniref:DUF1330 domain-containing protein n=1 Tax=Bacillus sp. RAR_GA_16 TaxID=2876774 RepID=UPI001CCE1A3D|nr:DUF1330 domain-containing protein [Bacillus sp. RAR_GA_16]MCA0170691.1 DUF1330 domain-containing protein [Bacillus sp. RAR_GA_16]
MALYALNLFNVKDGEEYAEYARRAEEPLRQYGGKVVAYGKLHSSPEGDIAPRQVMMLVEWESKEGIYNYVNDPNLEDLHPHRELGVDDFVWHLFEKLEDLRPVLK